uniref:Uncharacterized protein n=1 Tax=Cairina moschata TaxID=8855 RepID=A0A8C3BUW7_CAIMO
MMATTMAFSQAMAVPETHSITSQGLIAVGAGGRDASSSEALPPRAGIQGTATRLSFRAGAGSISSGAACAGQGQRAAAQRGGGLACRAGPPPQPLSAVVPAGWTALPGVLKPSGPLGVNGHCPWC